MRIKLTVIEPEQIVNGKQKRILYGDFNVLNFLYKADNQISSNIDIYPDSTAIYFLLRYYYKVKIKKIVSTDFQEEILGIANGLNKKIFLFGDTDEVLDRTVTSINKKYKRIIISGKHNGYDYTDENMIQYINSSGTDILFVGLGAGRQERWINNNYNKLNICTIISTGGWFQYLSGQKKRAPVFLRNLNLEWFMKLMVEFRRVWKRYLFTLPVFIFRIITKKITLEIK